MNETVRISSYRGTQSGQCEEPPEDNDGGPALHAARDGPHTTEHIK